MSKEGATKLPSKEHQELTSEIEQRLTIAWGSRRASRLWNTDINNLISVVAEELAAAEIARRDLDAKIADVNHRINSLHPDAFWGSGKGTE